MSKRREQEANSMARERILDIVRELEELTVEGFSEEEIEKIEEAVQCLDYILDSRR